MKKIKNLLDRIINVMRKNIFFSVLPIALIVLIVGTFAIGLAKSVAIIFIILIITFFLQYGGKIMRRSKKYNQLKKNKGKLRNLIINSILMVVILGIIFSALFVAFIVITAPKFNPNNLYRKEASTVYDANGDVITKLGTEIREKITFDEMPQVLVDAIIATEDSRFYQHNGFDLPRFLKASLSQALGRGGGGASTITMQVAKNNFTSTKVSVTRKFTDIYMSVFKIERNYSKEQILEFYVNAPYLGANSYGVAEAARNYFGKDVKDLNLAEASMIAGLFQAPGYYDPYIDPERAEQRRSTVLYLMQLHGYITKQEADIANSIPIKSLLKGKQQVKNGYQSFVDTVISEAEEKTGYSPYNVPMNIYTTLDTTKQDYLNRVMDGELFTWPNDVVQSGVAITNTNTGAILALGGGRNLKGERVFNYATMLKKQPGSTAKPIFDYGPGIEYNNWSTYTPFLDEPWSYSNGTSVQDWDGKFMGLLTLKQALGLSRNIPALKAFQQLNNKDSMNFALSLGIKPEIDNGRIHEAHALGAFTGVSPLQMAAAYASFGNGGYYIKPYTINKITFIDTGETKEYNPVKNKVMSDSTAYLITNALMWAVQSGLSGGARISGYQTAAKTGTTNFDEDTIKAYGLPAGALNDLWIIGYTPDYSIGLWYGYDTINKSYVNTLTDGTRKDRLFNTILKGIISGSTKTFKVPSSVAAVEVEKETIPGSLPSEFTPQDMRITEYFKKGTEPTDVSERYAQLPDVTGVSVVQKSGKLHITWNKMDTPDLYTDDYMQKYFDTYYGNQSAKYMQEFKDTTSTQMGVLGYEVYYKDSDGTAHSLGFTQDTSMDVDAPDDSGNLTFGVKSEWSIFKANASDGSEFKFTNQPVSVVDINIVGGSNTTLSIGSPFPQPTLNDISVTDNFTTVDQSKLTLMSIVITKQSTNTTINYSSIDTTVADTYDIKYTIEYNNQQYTADKIVQVK